MLFKHKVLSIIGAPDYTTVYSDARLNGRRVKFWGVRATPAQIEKIKALSPHIIKVRVGAQRNKRHPSHTPRPSLHITIDCNLRELVYVEKYDKYYLASEIMNPPAPVKKVKVVVEKSDWRKELTAAYDRGETIELLCGKKWLPWSVNHCPHFNSPRAHYRIAPAKEVNTDPNSIIAEIEKLANMLPSNYLVEVKWNETISHMKLFSGK